MGSLSGTRSTLVKRTAPIKYPSLPVYIRHTKAVNLYAILEFCGGFILRLYKSLVFVHM